MDRLDEAKAILDAAEKWKQRCLLGGGSLFSEEKLWRRKYFEELKPCVERLNKGSGTFEDKLLRQPMTSQARRLLAEITWAYYLIVNSVKKKLDKIRTFWEPPSTPLPKNHWALGDVLDGGIVHPGPAYAGAHKWREFRFIVTMMLDWCSRSVRERESLLGEPWRFAEWVDDQEYSLRRQFRHALLFLLFPEVFETILSIRHKQAIVKAFADETGNSFDIDRMSLIELDKALAAMRPRLRDQYPGHGINFFYESPIKELWQGVPSAGDSTAEEGDEDEQQGRGRRPNFNFDEMRIPVGSRLVSEKTGEEATVFSNNRVTFRNERMSLSDATEKTLGYRTNPCPQWTFEGRNVGDIYRETYGPKPEDKPPDPVPPTYDITTALAGLFVEETQFGRILSSIKLRKNLILQGPPGVGKTFIARRIAWCLIGRKDSGPIEMVQFHQSYAYEDFVQGWRPNEAGGFILRNGVFFEFCKRAERQPETPYIFIIDEINRGNLSKIFGELLMLIEADKRGPEHAIPLTYGASGERFSVPDNVHLLGLMNTADRSLAMVDYALRRRFAFETLEPAYGSRKFREYLQGKDVDRVLVDRIDRNLSALNERIREDKDLGPGFQVGHSYFVPQRPSDELDEQWYLGIVDTQIAPLLREYWFDRPEEVERRVEELRR